MTDDTDADDLRIVLATATAIGAFIMGSALAAGEPLRIAPENRLLGLLFTLAAFGFLMLEGRTSDDPTEYVLKPDTSDMDDARNRIWNVTVEYPATGNSEVFTVRAPPNADPDAVKFAANDLIIEGKVTDAEQDTLWTVNMDALHADR